MSNRKQELNHSKADFSAEESKLQEIPSDFQRVKTLPKDERGVAVDPAIPAGRPENNAERLLRKTKRAH